VIAEKRNQMMTTTLEQADIFNKLSTKSQIERTILALEANGIRVLIAETNEQAREIFLALVPEDVLIYQDCSMTLDTLGITEDIEEPGRFSAIRPRLRALERQSNPEQVILLGASPDYMVGSVHAVTEDGCVLIGSHSGSQLGPYVSGAKNVIWIVGAQKIVKDLDEGVRRVKYALPLENERLQKTHDAETDLSKLLIVYKERPGRITMILVNQILGF
jgi:hypothetical protein